MESFNKQQQIEQSMDSSALEYVFPPKTLYFSPEDVRTHEQTVTLHNFTSCILNYNVELPDPNVFEIKQDDGVVGLYLNKPFPIRYIPNKENIHSGTNHRLTVFLWDIFGRIPLCRRDFHLQIGYNNDSPVDSPIKTEEVAKATQMDKKSHRPRIQWRYKKSQNKRDRGDRMTKK